MEYEGAPGKRMIGCWAHARRKFVEALDEDKKHASEALVYIGKLYGIEKEMQEAGLDRDAIRKRRQEESCVRRESKMIILRKHFGRSVGTAR